MKYIVSYDYKNRGWYDYGNVEVNANNVEEAIEKACKKNHLKRQDYSMYAVTEAEKQMDDMWVQKKYDDDNWKDRVFIEAWLASDGVTKEEVLENGFNELKMLNEELEELKSIQKELTFLMELNEERKDEIKRNLEWITDNYKMFKE